MPLRWRRVLFIVASLVLGFLTIALLHRPRSPVISEYESLLADDEQARHICKKSRFQFFEDRQSRKVYDLFLVGTELDLLEIRLNTLDPVVDYFVIVESRQTFTRNSKPLYVSDNMHRFARFKHKIILRVIDFDNVEGDLAWAFESYSRNALYTEVFPTLPDHQRAQPNDVLLVSDIDEIPKPDTIRFLKSCHFPLHTTLESNFYYYSFQWRHRGKRWLHPQATFYQSHNRTILPQDLRTSAHANAKAKAQYRVLYDAAWHCSSCFSTVSEVQAKLESFSHQEFNHPIFKDPAQIVRRFRQGIDMAEREFETYDRIDDNPDVPTYLAENPGRFPWLLSRDPPNANFLDFHGEGASSLQEWPGPWPSVWPQ